VHVYHAYNEHDEHGNNDEMGDFKVAENKHLYQNKNDLLLIDGFDVLSDNPMCA
jgi:hypothetical protein